MLQKRFGKFLRVTAIVTLVTYIPTNFSYAGDMAPPTEISIPASVQLSQSFALALPANLGRIDSLHPGHKGTIIHLQSAHGHYEAQDKIEKILQTLSEKYISFPILLEGAVGTLDPTLLNFFPNQPELNQKNARWLAKKALVSGPELFLMKNTGVRGYGIENETAYNRNHEQFADVLKARTAAENFSQAFDREMEKAAAIFSPDLRGFLKRLEQHELGIVPMDVWLFEIQKAALKHLKVDLTDAAWQLPWPMLVRFFKIQKISKEWDRAKYEEEKTLFLTAVKERLPGKDLYKRIEELLNSEGQSIQLPEPETENTFVEMLRYLPRDFDFKAYPNVARFIGMLVLQSELNPARLFFEIERAQTLITEKLTRNETEKEILGVFSDYRLLKKILALQLTPADFEQLEPRTTGHEPRIKPSELAERLQKIETVSAKKMQFTHLTEIDSVFEKAVAFYQGAKARDDVMVQRIQERLKQYPSKFAVVVTGGFHTAAMRDRFEKEGYTYAVATPAISGPDEDGYRAYLKAMLQTIPAAQNTIHAKDTASNQMIQPKATMDRGFGGPVRDAALQLIVAQVRAGKLMASSAANSAKSEVALSPASSTGRSEIRKKIYFAEVAYWKESGKNRAKVLAQVSERFQLSPDEKKELAHRVGLARSEMRPTANAAGALWRTGPVWESVPLNYQRSLEEKVQDFIGILKLFKIEIEFNGESHRRYIRIPLEPEEAVIESDSLTFLGRAKEIYDLVAKVAKGYGLKVELEVPKEYEQQSERWLAIDEQSESAGFVERLEKVLTKKSEDVQPAPFPSIDKGVFEKWPSTIAAITFIVSVIGAGMNFIPLMQWMKEMNLIDLNAPVIYKLSTLVLMISLISTFSAYFITKSAVQKIDRWKLAKTKLKTGEGQAAFAPGWGPHDLNQKRSESREEKMDYLKSVFNDGIASTAESLAGLERSGLLEQSAEMSTERFLNSKALVEVGLFAGISLAASFTALMFGTLGWLVIAASALVGFFTYLSSWPGFVAELAHSSVSVAAARFAEPASDFFLPSRSEARSAIDYAEVLAAIQNADRFNSETVPDTNFEHWKFYAGEGNDRLLVQLEVLSKQDGKTEFRGLRVFSPGAGGYLNHFLLNQIFYDSQNGANGEVLNPIFEKEATSRKAKLISAASQKIQARSESRQAKGDDLAHIPTFFDPAAYAEALQQLRAREDRRHNRNRFPLRATRRVHKSSAPQDLADTPKKQTRSELRKFAEKLAKLSDFDYLAGGSVRIDVSEVTWPKEELHLPERAVFIFKQFGRPQSPEYFEETLKILAANGFYAVRGIAMTGTYVGKKNKVDQHYGAMARFASKGFSYDDGAIRSKMDDIYGTMGNYGVPAGKVLEEYDISADQLTMAWDALAPPKKDAAGQPIWNKEGRNKIGEGAYIGQLRLKNRQTGEIEDVIVINGHYPQMRQAWTGQKIIVTLEVAPLLAAPDQTQKTIADLRLLLEKTMRPLLGKQGGIPYAGVVDSGANGFHGSDSRESAGKEATVWFGDSEPDKRAESRRGLLPSGASVTDPNARTNRSEMRKVEFALDGTIVREVTEEFFDYVHSLERGTFGHRGHRVFQIDHFAGGATSMQEWDQKTLGEQTELIQELERVIILPDDLKSIRAQLFEPLKNTKRLLFIVDQDGRLSAFREDIRTPQFSAEGNRGFVIAEDLRDAGMYAISAEDQGRRGRPSYGIANLQTREAQVHVQIADGKIKFSLRSESHIPTAEEVRAANLLLNHLVARQREVQSNSVLVVLGNSELGYGEAVARLAQKLQPEKIIIVGKGNQAVAERKRLRNEIVKTAPELQDKILVDRKDKSMNTGENVDVVARIAKKHALDQQFFVVTQHPVGTLLSWRIFEHQWDAKASKIGLKYKPVFMPYAPEMKMEPIVEGVALSPEQEHILNQALGQMDRLQRWHKGSEAFITHHADDTPKEIIKAAEVVSTLLSRSEARRGLLPSTASVTAPNVSKLAELARDTAIDLIDRMENFEHGQKVKLAILGFPLLAKNLGAPLAELQVEYDQKKPTVTKKAIQQFLEKKLHEIYAYSNLTGVKISKLGPEFIAPGLRTKNFALLPQKSRSESRDDGGIPWRGVLSITAGVLSAISFLSYAMTKFYYYATLRPVEIFSVDFQGEPEILSFLSKASVAFLGATVFIWLPSFLQKTTAYLGLLVGTYFIVTNYFHGSTEVAALVLAGIMAFTMGLIKRQPTETTSQLGELTASAPEESAAETEFKRALKIARDENSRTWLNASFAGLVGFAVGTVLFASQGVGSSSLWGGVLLGGAAAFFTSRGRLEDLGTFIKIEKFLDAEKDDEEQLKALKLALRLMPSGTRAEENLRTLAFSAINGLSRSELRVESDFRSGFVGSVPNPDRMGARNRSELRVLMVEDDQATQTILQARLRKQFPGIVIVSAEDTKQAREAVAQPPFDAVLVASDLPAEAAHAVVEAIREEGKGISAPIIVWAGSGVLRQVKTAVARFSDVTVVERSLDMKFVTNELQAIVDRRSELRQAKIPYILRDKTFREILFDPAQSPLSEQQIVVLHDRYFLTEGTLSQKDVATRMGKKSQQVIHKIQRDALLKAQEFKDYLKRRDEVTPYAITDLIFDMSRTHTKRATRARRIVGEITLAELRQKMKSADFRDKLGWGTAKSIEETLIKFAPETLRTNGMRENRFSMIPAGAGLGDALGRVAFVPPRPNDTLLNMGGQTRVFRSEARGLPGKPAPSPTMGKPKRLIHKPETARRSEARAGDSLPVDTSLPAQVSEVPTSTNIYRLTLEQARAKLIELLGGITPRGWYEIQNASFETLAARIQAFADLPVVYAAEVPVAQVSRLPEIQAGAGRWEMILPAQAFQAGQVVLHPGLVNLIAGNGRAVFEMLKQFSLNAKIDVAPLVFFTEQPDLKAQIRKTMLNKNLTPLTPEQRRMVDGLLELLQVEVVKGIAAEGAINKYVAEYKNSWGIAVLLPNVKSLDEIQNVLAMALSEQSFAADDALALAKIVQVLGEAALLGSDAQITFLERELPNLTKAGRGWVVSLIAVIDALIATHELTAVSA